MAHKQFKCRNYREAAGLGSYSPAILRQIRLNALLYKREGRGRREAISSDMLRLYHRLPLWRHNLDLS